MRNGIPRAARAIAAALCLALPVGCGYSIHPPYNPKIRTVYVPVFKSVRFRRGLELELTKMVQEEIQNRTPYTVVGSPEGADAWLEGTIMSDDKNVYVENPNNLPRHMLTTLHVSVTFTDSRTKAKKTRAVAPVVVVENAPFYPEIGETATLGFRKAMQQIARDIVGMMEDPWGENVAEPEPEED